MSDFPNKLLLIRYNLRMTKLYAGTFKILLKCGEYCKKYRSKLIILFNKRGLLEPSL